MAALLTFFVMGAVLCTMLSSTSGFYALDAKSTTLTSCHNPKCLQTGPNVP